MASQIPKAAKKAITDGYAAETLYACLLTSTFPNTLGAYAVYGDLTNEVVGTGYVAGGKEVTGRTSAYSTNDAVLDATADIAWPASTFADVKYIAVYSNGATKSIRAIMELATPQSVTSGTFTIQWNASGIIKVA